ncbi:MAG: hypothetical protein A4E49_03161 [Methanosaeta sp. PtaU1.Bin112]|nr:MAG: hypothetical protein A4E49_03161 [Methanosaeta sp. PtaU1.Bin112]
MSPCINSRFCQHWAECDPRMCEDYVPALQDSSDRTEVR